MENPKAVCEGSCPDQPAVIPHRLAKDGPSRYAAAQPAPAAPHACARPRTPRGVLGPGPSAGRLPGSGSADPPVSIHMVVRYFLNVVIRDFIPSRNKLLRVGRIGLKLRLISAGPHARGELHAP